MKTNESSRDRIVRATGSALLAFTALAGPGPKTSVGKVLLGIAGVLGTTAVTGFCPLYRIAGVSTCDAPKA